MKNATFFTRSARLSLFPFFFFLVSFLYAANGNLSGSGTSSSPYIIEDTADWNKFASNINDGIDASSFYMLSDNFDNTSNPITTMCGTSESYSFKGTFDGNAKTLTVNFNVSSENAGPFRYAKNAIIQNLTVTGNITTSNKYAGGFIGSAYAIVTIQNCISSVTINSSVNGDGTHGGLIGLAQGGSSIFFTNCLFNGKLLGSNTHSNSGFLGYNGGVLSTFVNCLFAPEQITMDSESSATFNRNGHNSFDNCYYKKKYGEKHGQDASSLSEAELLALLGGCWEIKEGLLKPLQGQNMLYFANVDGLKEIYTASGISPVDDDYEVSLYGVSLTKNTDYELKIKDESGNEISSLNKNGRYFLAFNGIGSYMAEKVFPFNYYLYGEGTEESPYLLTDADDWNNFAKLVNEKLGNRFEGLYFALKNDIDFLEGSIAFTRMSNGDHTVDEFDNINSENCTYFAGTFDGRGYSISGLGDVNCYGLFSITSDSAVIKNLYLKNCIIRGRNRTGGIVGINHGTISNCHVTDDVYVFAIDFPSNGGNDTDKCWSHGGIAGINYGGTIEGCTSAATVWDRNFDNREYGGIAGYNSGLVKHCFYYGKKLESGSEYGAIIGSYVGGSYVECLHTCENLGGVNESNDENATIAYKILVGMENISINYNSTDSISYGLVTAADKTLCVGDVIYAPKGVVLNLDFDYKDLPFEKENLCYEYVYKEAGQTKSVVCENIGGKYSFTMPESNIVIYAGYNWQGDGSENDPYKINNIYQLEYLSVKVNSMEKTYEDKYFILENDIEASGNFTPIGGIFNENALNFCGTFDGKGFAISNLNINCPKYSGLFGRLGSKGKVQNLLVKNSNFTGDFAAGAIAGFNEGTIEGCTVDDTVSVISESSASSCFGGITGYNKGTIEKSTSSAKVSAFTRAGGITGYNYDGIIKNCLYQEEEADSVRADNSYSGYIAGHLQDDKNGSLEQNYYIGEKLYALGSAKGGYDDEGAKRLYRISTSLVENLSFEEDAKGQVIDSHFYAASGSNIKLNLGSYILEDGDEIFIKDINQTEVALKCSSFTNGILNFTMPAYDVEIVAQEKDSGNTENGNEGNEPSGEMKITANKDPYNKNTFYTSFYSSKNSYKLPEGLKVFYVISKGSRLSLEEVSDRIINAGEGVIIQSPEESFILTLCEKSKAYKNNILKGTDSEINAPQNAYTLGFSKRGGVGFYKANSGEEPCVIGANKAYILMEAE